VLTAVLAAAALLLTSLLQVLWLKSRNSEVWLDRRTTYTRSTAVMSMVGYLLGLGDRHPSNLMLDRYSGKLLHIDFGDCFEASMNRDKFPEKVSQGSGGGVREAAAVTAPANV
jgi:phosphatidylinositol kinase/protein kinase (PI-3  family)